LLWGRGLALRDTGPGSRWPGVWFYGTCWAGLVLSPA